MPKAVAYAEDLYRRAGDTVADVARQAATAAGTGDFAAAVTAADRLRRYADDARTAVVRDALAASATWWTIAEHLALHPQATYEQYRHIAENLRTPAQQQPHLAVVCTAGLAAEHDQDDEYGIDLDDLGDDHSLTADPTVARLHAAAQLLDDDVWISVRLPGECEGDDDLDDDNAVITRWTSVVTHPDDLGWLREALQLRGDDAGDAEDDLEPL